MTARRIKRIYEGPSGASDHRVLVGRLWPRGISKKAAYLGEWCKNVAPSTEVRRDFGHDPVRFGEFETRHHVGLATFGAVGVLTERLARRPMVTLLYAAHDSNINQVVVLRKVLSDPQVIS